MQINSYQQKDLLEDRIDVFYREKTKEITAILAYLLQGQATIMGDNEGRQRLLKIADIYYFEAVDKKVFAYTKEHTYRVDSTLKELEQGCQKQGCVRVNKATIINIYKIGSLKTDLHMRVIATLQNQEQVIINRSYKKTFQQFLQSYNKGVKV